MDTQLGTHFPHLHRAALCFAPNASSGDLGPDQLRKIEAILAQLSLPPRVGACSLHASVAVQLSGTQSVEVSWPAECGGADVVFLVHSGPISARMRQRMQDGPAHFVVVADASEIPVGFAALPGQVIAQARARHVQGQLAALGQPQLTPLIDALARDIIALGEGVDKLRPLQVGVVGTLPPGIDLGRAVVVAGQHPEVDAVVAVRPARGWTPHQIEQLRAVLAAVGRLVELAPCAVPLALPGAVLATPDTLAEVLVRHCAKPPVTELPAPQLATWERIAARMESTHSLQRVAGLEANPVAACKTMGVVAPMQWTANFAIELLVITTLAWVALSRVLGGLPLLCAVVGLVIVRAWVKQQQLRVAWARGEIRSRAVAGQLPGRDPRAMWLRKTMAELVK
ncbi:hypothetical protein QVA66_07740 [Staphylococcus chromogenes]|nr:hypothetical protein [Staphylococcus chromogenes]